MSSGEKNRYWIPNLDINKKVITQEILYYLGPESTVRPSTREGEGGFLITTPGECLTDEQIDDICRKSKEVWEKQATARSQKMSRRGKIKKWENLFKTRKEVAKSREEMNKYRRNVDEMAHDMNNPVVLELYTQLILLEHNAGKDHAVFENPDHVAQGVLHALARKLGFEYEYSLLKMQVTISKPASVN